MIPYTGSNLPRHLVALAVLCSLIVSMLAPSSAMAQEPPIVPAGGHPAGEIVDDSALASGVEPAVIDATTDTPFALVGRGVSSFSAPSPGVYWMTESTCESTGPRAADGVEPGDVDPADVDPAAVDAATPFYVLRTTYTALEERMLQYRPDPTGGTPSQCAGQYKVNSNIVANQKYVYWVDAQGLQRLPVTANYLDTPQLVDDNWRANTRVDLKMAGTLLFGAFNSNGTGGPLGSLGWSSIDYHNTETGVSETIKFSFGANFGFSAPDYDGTYVYFKIDRTLKRINLDGTDEQTIAGNVGPYVSDGRRLQFCQIGGGCTFTHYLFYSKFDGVIYRHSLIDGTIAGIQTRAGRTIHALTTASIPSVPIIEIRRVFWIESYHENIGSPFPVRQYHYSLNRASFSGGAAIDNLYNVSPALGNEILFGNMTSNGEHLLWQQGATIQRLPNDAAALPKVDMTITGYEITQGIQKSDNSVALLRGRNTYLRVFVDAVGADVPGVTMRLVSNQGGGSLVPINGMYLTVKDNPDRKQIQDSFLFALPNVWTNASNLTLSATLNPMQMPMEPTYANNGWTSPPINFVPAYPLRLNLVEANYVVGTGANEVGWNVNDTATNISWLRRALPLAEDGLQYTVTTLNGGLALGNHVLQVAQACAALSDSDKNMCAANWVNAKLNGMIANPAFRIPGNVYMYGLINDGAAFPRGWAAGRAGAGPTGTRMVLAGTAPNYTVNYSDYGQYSGHEISHMLGRAHPSPASDDPNTKDKKEGCEHSRSDDNFKYPNAQIGYGDGNIWGFDRDYPAGGRNESYRVLDDSNYFDMMSYCGDWRTSWISPYTWEGVYTWLKDHQTQAADLWMDGSADVSAAVVEGGDFIALFGFAYPDAVAVFVANRQSSAIPSVEDAEGAFELRMLDGGGTALDTFRFGGATPPDEGESFGVVTVLAAGTATLQIVRVSSGAVLYTQSISPNAPAVSNVALPGAPNPVDGTVSVTWNATDADNDALTVDLYYTFDDGASWQPVTLGITGNTTAVDTTTLGGGTGHFRVVVSDGVNQASAESAPFTIVAKPPTVAIASPADGAHYGWKQMILLEGYAWDTLDGGMDGASMVWSNQHGAVGSGATLSTDALATGQNLLTLTATNSAGLSASKSVTVTIGDALGAGPATGSAAPSALGFQFNAPADPAQTKSLSLTNVGGAGLLPWSATASEPWLTIAPASGADLPATLQVTVSPAALANDRTYSGYVQVTLTATGQPPHYLNIPVGMTIGNSFTGVPLPSAPTQQVKTFLPAIAK